MISAEQPPGGVNETAKRRLDVGRGLFRLWLVGTAVWLVWTAVDEYWWFDAILYEFQAATLDRVPVGLPHG